MKISEGVNKKAVIIIIIAIIVVAIAACRIIFKPAPKSEPEEKGGKEALLSEEEAIKKLFAEKYDKELSEITINISQETENYLRGEVEFQPGGPGSSGGFLAAKVNGDWELVYDGNGVIFCSVIEPYNFPVNMVMECFDEETEEPRDRTGEACVNSGGAITTFLCCMSTGDYPNLCLIGPCGCSPDNSHQIKICDCGTEKCFNGEECVPFEELKK